MIKKKILVLPLILLLLTGCGQAAIDNSANNEASDKAATEATIKDDAKETVENKEENDVNSKTPAEFVAEMTVGWNLGNSFDAWGGSGLEDETHWGNPKTTKEMIDAVHEKGFDCIRIPITWYDHMGPAPDYTVDESWMARVEEVVNYALDDGMYVMINSHHEEEWRIPDNAHIDAVDEQHRALWLQIAERFKDYDEHLIFEGLNEPRVKGGENEWNGGTKEVRDCVNRLNQSFVDTVRSTGGNNAERLLIVTTVADSPMPDAINDLVIPEDDHIAVAIHAYTPYDFTFVSDASIDVWDGSRKSDIDWMFSNLKTRFIDKGIPVLMTEYGAVNKNGNDEAVCAWVNYYLNKAKELGIPCFWWDNNQYTAGNEFFSIFNRNDLTWCRESVADEIMSVYNK